MANVAADIFHSHFEEVHEVCESFQKANNVESLNKIMQVLGQLHGASGAQYLYAEDAEYSSMWLCDNGRKVLTQLIIDAKTSKLDNSATVLEIFMKDLQDSKLV